MCSFFGQRFIVSEHQFNKYFESNMYPPTCSCYVGDNKVKVNYWYTEVDKLLRHEIKVLFSEEDCVGVMHMELAIGDVHGLDFFMLLKVLP